MCRGSGGMGSITKLNIVYQLIMQIDFAGRPPVQTVSNANVGAEHKYRKDHHNHKDNGQPGGDRACKMRHE